MTTERRPKRGEIWLVNFNPTRGDEIQKARPAVVVSSDGLGKLRLRVVVPFTSSQRGNPDGNAWMVPVKASPYNHLNGDTTADALQLRSVSTERFLQFIGPLEADLLAEVVAAAAIVLEFQ